MPLPSLVDPGLPPLAERVRFAERTADRDWYLVPWGDVASRTGLAPTSIPGVRTTADVPVERLPTVGSPSYGKAMAASAATPFPYRVHRSHLPLLKYQAPPEATPIEEDARRVLRPHQAVGVRFLRERSGAILADQMRCGKTPQIVYAHDPAAGPLVVVGPLASRAVWHEWAARRFGRCGESACTLCDRIGAPASSIPSFRSLTGRTPSLDLLRRSGRVFHLTYAVISPWSEQFLAFGEIGTLCADEVHLAGVQSRRNVTIVGLKRLMTCANRRVMASGSPLWNMPKGLYPIVDIACPAAFGSWTSFSARYCAARPTAHGWKADGISNERELDSRLSAILLRRTWPEIASSLPPITRTLELVELTGEENRQVVEAAAELRRGAAQGKPQTVIGNLERLRKLYAKQKAKRAIALAIEARSEGHSVIVWTWHRDVATRVFEAIREFFGSDAGVEIIDGRVDPAERERRVEGLRASQAPKVLIATMGALGTAVNLSFASQQFFAELDWTPAVIEQAEMRCFDGLHPVASVFLVADCEVDRKQAEVLLSKIGTAGALRLRGGLGDVSEVLCKAFGVDPGVTLDEVAERIVEEERNDR